MDHNEPQPNPIRAKASCSSLTSVLHAGMKLGKFLLRAKLGNGATSEVWAAHNEDIGKTVALKIPKVGGRASLAKEAKRSVKHAYIVDIQDTQVIDDALSFLVMEWLDGCTLSAEFDAGTTFAVERACTIVLQMASAVGTLHAHGIVHRDISHKNIFLEKENGRFARVKLIDFGLAQNLDDCDPSNFPRKPEGTPGYIAPEHISPPHCIGAQGDVFALGVILYECLRGQRLWKIIEAKQAATLTIEGYTQALTNLEPLLDELPNEVPDELKHLLRHVLKFDPAERGSIDALFAGLSKYVTTPVEGIRTKSTQSRELTQDAAHTDDGATGTNETLSAMTQSIAEKRETGETTNDAPNSNTETQTIQSNPRKRPAAYIAVATGVLSVPLAVWMVTPRPSNGDLSPNEPRNGAPNTLPVASSATPAITTVAPPKAADNPGQRSLIADNKPKNASVSPTKSPQWSKKTRSSQTVHKSAPTDDRLADSPSAAPSKGQKLATITEKVITIAPQPAVNKSVNAREAEETLGIMGISQP